MKIEDQKTLNHNFIINVLDGGIFGGGLGFSSFITVLPLFFSHMTDSPIIIGLIPSIHTIGWQLPQLLIAPRTSGLSYYKPSVLIWTLQERLPFLGLAAIAWFLPELDTRMGLALSFIMLVWHGLSAGATAVPWQSMIGKIFPADRIATFYSVQSAAGNLLQSLTAIAAGLILRQVAGAHGYFVCFVCTSAFFAVGFFVLAQTKETDRPPLNAPINNFAFWSHVGDILRNNSGFRRFLVMRMISQLSILAFSFYSIYAVKMLQVDALLIGLMTSFYMGAQIFSNLIMGWMADHWSRRLTMGAGILCAVLSALLAWWAPSAPWFFAVYGLAGVANAAIWPIGLAMILDYGVEAEKPAYIGLANTFAAFPTILGPILGGILANQFGYAAAFQASAFFGIITIIILVCFMQDSVISLDVPTPVVLEPSESETPATIK